MSDQYQYVEEQTDHTVPVFFLFFMLLLALVLLLGRALHDHPKLNSFLSEPAMTLLVSVFFSFLIKIFFVAEDYAFDEDQQQQNDYDNEDQNNDNYYNNVVVDQNKLSEFLLTFPGEVFFMVFLPPIMFNSGYELKRELFFRHLKPIVSFAVLGTALAGIATGLMLWGVSTVGWIDPVSMNVLELLTFGSLISATDTVSQKDKLIFSNFAVEFNLFAYIGSATCWFHDDTTRQRSFRKVILILCVFCFLCLSSSSSSL